MACRVRCIISLLLLAATAVSRLIAQEATCSKLLLFPLRNRSLEVTKQDRTDLNVYHYCASGDRGETELSESGIDLSVVYDAAGILSTDPSRVQALAAWASKHCGEYSITRFPQLSGEVKAILEKMGPQVQNAYESCLKAPVGLSCYGAPVGAGAISLLFAWRPKEATSPTPELSAVRATGAVAPGDLLDGRTREASESGTIISLQGLRVPREGLVRGLLRLDPRAEVTFSANSAAGDCTTEPVLADEKVYRPSVYKLEPVEGQCDKDGCLIGLRNGDISVSVADLPKALAELVKEKKISEKAGIEDLVPVIDGVAIPGVNPMNPGNPSEPEKLLGGQIEQKLRFHLERIDGNEASKKAWSELLSNHWLKRRVTFTLGFENGANLHSWLTAKSTKAEEKIQLIVVPQVEASIGAVLIGGALILFLALARRTDLIRDTTTRRRPDGRNPFSLARTQMAFWFFLVAASYFGIWMISGDKNTITASVLTLIGISAGTALGAAVVDAGKMKPEDLDSDVVDSSFLEGDVVGKLKAQKNEAQHRLEALLKAREGIDATNVNDLEANRRAQEEEKKKYERIKRQIEFFSQPPWRRVFNDLLSDGGTIGFHRFQIFVWTLVLGIIFIREVINHLTMPDFNATLLAIMGISGGTYIGFKLPDAKNGTTDKP